MASCNQLLCGAKAMGCFELIAGERRMRAAMLAGLSTIPALVRNSNDEKSLALALVENIQRQKLESYGRS